MYLISSWICWLKIFLNGCKPRAMSKIIWHIESPTMVSFLSMVLKWSGSDHLNIGIYYFWECTWSDGRSDNNYTNWAQWLSISAVTIWTVLPIYWTFCLTFPFFRFQIKDYFICTQPTSSINLCQNKQITYTTHIELSSKNSCSSSYCLEFVSNYGSTAWNFFKLRQIYSDFVCVQV